MRPLIVVLTCLAALVIGYGQAPSSSLLQNLGGTADESARWILRGSDGALVTLSTSGPGLVLAKRDASGNVAWTDFYSAEPSDAAALPDGGVVVVGRVDRGNIPGAKEGILLRFDSAGVLVWKQLFPGVTSLPDPALKVTADSSGAIYVGGTVAQDAFSDLAAMKFDPNGSPLWTKTVGPSPGQEICLGVSLDAGGNLVVIGNRTAGTPLLYKFAPDGSKLWEYAPVAPGVATGFAFDTADACYLAVSGTIPYLVKVGANGAQVFKTSLPATSNPLAVSVLAGNAYLGGAEADGSGSVTKVGPTGAIAWKAVHSDPAGPESFNSVVASSDGSVYAAGNRTLNGSATLLTFKVGSTGTPSWILEHGAYTYTPPVVPVPNPLPPALVPTTVFLDGLLQPITFSTVNGPGSPTGYDTQICVDTSTGTPLAVNQSDLGGTQDFAVASSTDSLGNTYLIAETQQGNGADVRFERLTQDGLVQWQWALGGPGPDLAYAVTALPNGGAIGAYGVYNASTSLWNTYVRKYDLAGALQWSVGPLSGSPHVTSMALGSDGSCFLLAQEQGTSPFRIRVIKLGGDGALLWNNTYEGLAAGDDYAAKIALDGSGNAYAVGNVWSGDRYYATMLRFDGATGNADWGRTYSFSLSGAAAFSLALDGKGFAYLVGTDWANGARGLIRKFDLAGNVMWTQVLADSDTISERFLSAAIDPSGNLVVGGSAILPSKNLDLLVAKYSSSGALIWKRTYDGPASGGDNGKLLTLDRWGGAYLAGTVSGGVTGKDSAIWKLNADGSDAWPDSGNDFRHSAYVYEGGQGLADFASGLNVDSVGGLYFTGSTIGQNLTYDLQFMKFGETVQSEFVSQSVPSTMVAGQTYTVTLSFRNRSSVEWSAASGFDLGSVNPVGNMTWSLNSVALGSSEVIAPGSTKKFQFRVFAPASNGTYDFQWQMRQQGVEFGQASTDIPVVVTVAANAARYVSQTQPTSVKAGASFNVTVTMKNVGSNTWTAAAGYNLAPTGGTSAWGISQVNLASGDSIAPGQTKKFSFTAKAPSTAGTYTMRFQMRKGTTFFGDQTTLKGINVTP